MDSSGAQQNFQEMGSQTLESIMVCTTKPQQEKKPRPAAEEAQKCPRCDSTNTKFCYYNNYSLTQPRYFCKSCRRYWTKGGTLRNVPVGGGCRKNRRPSPSSSSPLSLTKRSGQDQSQSLLPAVNNSNNNNPNPLSNLSPIAFAGLQNVQLAGIDKNGDVSFLTNPEVLDISSNHGFLDVLRCGFLETAPRGSHSLYYGGGVDFGGGGSIREEMAGMAAPPYDYISGGGATTTAGSTMKEEFWGFPWQLGGGDHVNMVETDASGGRQSWNNGLGSSSSSTTWHGLLNSPLM